jgi:cytochrome c oxidase subunit 3
MHSAGAQFAPLSDRQQRMYLGAFWLFLLAESLIFVTLFYTRFLMAGAGRSPALNYVLGTLITVLFVASVLPARQAARSMSKGDVPGMNRALLVTLALGILALAAIVYDWFRISLPAGSRFGENYFLTTGLHALHIVIGILALLGLWANGRRGRFTTGNYWAVVAGVRFWYFVVAAWAGLFIVFFLI